MAVIKKTATKKARIEIIPLIDVIFFLLATFVLFTLSLNKLQSIPIELPQSRPDARPEEMPQVTTVQVSAEGTVYLDKESISIGDLPRRLNAIKQSKGDPRVLISGDSRASYGDAIRVLDMVHQAEIDKVSIQTTVASGK